MCNTANKVNYTCLYSQLEVDVKYLFSAKSTFRKGLIWLLLLYFLEAKSQDFICGLLQGNENKSKEVTDLWK